MKLADVAPVYKEMIATQAIIETGLHIPKGDLYVGHGATDVDGQYRLQVIAKQGDKSFVIVVADAPIDAAKFKREWHEAVAAHNAATWAERHEVTERSRVRERAVELLGQMLLAGFRRNP